MAQFHFLVQASKLDEFIDAVGADETGSHVVVKLSRTGTYNESPGRLYHVSLSGDQVATITAQKGGLDRLTKMKALNEEGNALFQASFAIRSLHN